MDKRRVVRHDDAKQAGRKARGHGIDGLYALGMRGAAAAFGGDAGELQPVVCALMHSPGDPVDIRNWQRRPDGITTSGKLQAADPARLARIGVRHVVNLALDTHPEALAGEAALCAAEGIAYTHIPVPFDAPTPAHVAALEQALAAHPGPHHVHCIMNWRVTAFFYLIDRAGGMPEPEARARMAEVWNPLEADDAAAAPWKALLA
jgi:uncharacterized protein (TIGR01244 family)